MSNWKGSIADHFAAGSKPSFKSALGKWGSPDFAKALKRELENLPAGALPLHQCVTQGGYVDGRNICVMVLRSDNRGSAIESKVGIFFTEIVGGCGCPIEPFEESVYCEMTVWIDKLTAEAEFRGTS